MSLWPLVATAVLGFPGVAYCTEPLEGIWNLDLEQTKFTAGARPPRQTLSIQQQGSDFLYTVTIPGAARPQITIKYTVPVRGGEGKFLIGNYDRVFHKRIDANTREARYFKDGKKAMTFRGTVTKDGRQLRITVTGTDAEGNPVAGLSVYTRQERRH